MMFCHVCDKYQSTYTQSFSGGVEWRCRECDTVLGTEFDDDEDEDWDEVWDLPGEVKE